MMSAIQPNDVNENAKSSNSVSPMMSAIQPNDVDENGKSSNSVSPMMSAIGNFSSNTKINKQQSEVTERFVDKDDEDPGDDAKGLLKVVNGNDEDDDEVSPDDFQLGGSTTISESDAMLLESSNLYLFDYGVLSESSYRNITSEDPLFLKAHVKDYYASFSEKQHITLVPYENSRVNGYFVSIEKDSFQKLYDFFTREGYQTERVDIFDEHGNKTKELHSF